MFLFSNDLFFLLPEISWLINIVVLLLMGTSLLANFRLILLSAFSRVFNFYILCLFFLYLQMPIKQYALFNYQYISDFFNFALKILFLLILVICIFVSTGYFIIERVLFVEYFFLAGVFCVSSFLLLSANDLTIFYLGIELQSLILYTFAALKRYGVFSSESGLKYFVLGALSSGLLLFGISLFYGFWGVLNFFDVKLLFLGWLDTYAYHTLFLAAAFLLSSILFKLSAAPFYIWVPDVYTGSPTPVVLVFATLPKLVLVGFFSRLVSFFLYEQNLTVYSILFFSGLLSVLVGTFGALSQVALKRLYAYSAVVNIGYLLSVLANGGGLEELCSVFNYLFIYQFSTIAVFLVVLLFRFSQNENTVKLVSEYNLLFSYSSTLAVLFGLMFFSLAGIPPLAGFFIKFFLFKTLFVADLLLNPAFFIMLVTSVVSSFYYIRVVRFIFFSTARAPALFIRLNYTVVLVFVLIVFTIVFFLIFQQFLLVFINYFVYSLFF